MNPQKNADHTPAVAAGPSSRGHCTASMAINKGPVIGRSVDANRRLVDDSNLNGPSGRQHSKLFQAFHLFPASGCHFRQLNQKITTVGVEADVLEKTGGSARNSRSSHSRACGMGLRLK